MSEQNHSNILIAHLSMIGPLCGSEKRRRDCKSTEPCTEGSNVPGLLPIFSPCSDALPSPCSDFAYSVYGAKYKTHHTSASRFSVSLQANALSIACVIRRKQNIGAEVGMILT